VRLNIYSNPNETGGEEFNETEWDATAKLEDVRGDFEYEPFIGSRAKLSPPQSGQNHPQQFFGGFLYPKT
jgi:hypothetical protein